MRTPRETRKLRRLKMPYVLLCVFVLMLTALIIMAYLMPKPGDNLEFQAIIKGARDDRARFAAAEAEARKAVPPDAPIPATWDYRPTLDALADGPRGESGALIALVRAYVMEGGVISDSGAEFIRKDLSRGKPLPADNPFFFDFTKDGITSPELKARLSLFLIESKALREAEAGYKLDLLQDISNAYRVPLDSNLSALGVLIAGRALAELQSGNAPRALETVLTGYGVAGLLENWPHHYAAANRYMTDQMLHRVLWRCVDADAVGPDGQQRIVQMFDAIKSGDRLAKALLLQGAYNITGEEADYRGLPRAAEFAFAFVGRGAFESAKQLASLVNTPPWQARQQLEPLEKHKSIGSRAGVFVDRAILAYQAHWREAMMGDIARLAFALKQWRQEHGAYPAALQDLKPFPLAELPKDPLTGGPLNYETDGASFSLKSASGSKPLFAEIFWSAGR